MSKNIGNHLESLGFIPQEFDEDWSEAIAFKDFLIMPEFPNGGMTALSVMDTVSGQWYSLPTGLGKHCPDGMKNFDYHEDDEAIAWLKNEITKFEAIAS
jgi:hypothetical protein